MPVIPGLGAAENPEPVCLAGRIVAPRFRVRLWRPGKTQN